jgi:hypothetical protein
MHSASSSVDSRRSSGLSFEARPERWNGKPVSSKPLRNTSAGQMHCSTHGDRVCVASGGKSPAEAQLTPARHGDKRQSYSTLVRPKAVQELVYYPTQRE